MPPNQAEVMFEALRGRGITTALVMFEGEQHGFRQAPNIRCGPRPCLLLRGAAPEGGCVMHACAHLCMCFCVVILCPPRGRGARGPGSWGA